MDGALTIQLQNNHSAALSSKSLYLPGCFKMPQCKMQLVATPDVLLLADGLMYYRVSNIKKQSTAESSNTTRPKGTGTWSMLQATTV